MKISRSLLQPLFALVLGTAALSGTASAQLNEDPGNLTITVQENENGTVTISASGTANIMNSGFFGTTSADPGVPTPPATITTETSIPLPPGITFTFPENLGSEQEPGAPQEANGDPITVPATTVEFDEPGVWALGRFSNFLQSGDTITGAGSVTVGNIPFSNFVPGTYVVEPELNRAKFFNLFQITYKVIPFSGTGRLTLQNARSFGEVQVNHPSRIQRLRLRNVGSATVTGIRGRLSVGASDFSARIVNARPLNPGQSLVVKVRFRPGRVGGQRSLFSVESSAPTVSTTLSGEGVNEINSPRFPRGNF